MISTEQRLLQQDAATRELQPVRIPVPRVIRGTALIFIGFFVVTRVSCTRLSFNWGSFRPARHLRKHPAGTTLGECGGIRVRVRFIQPYGPLRVFVETGNGHIFSD